MEVKNPLAFLDKREATHTKTFITNLAIGLVAFLIFTGISSIASAQEPEDDVPPPTREVQRENAAEALEARQAALEERREEMASRTEAMREQMEERRETMASRTEAVREQIAERRNALSERSRNRVLALADNISQKMNAAIARLEQIIKRFEVRVAALEGQGVDGSASEAKLDEAKDSLATAKQIVNNQVNDLIDAAVDAENPRETWGAARTAFTEAKTAIKDAHQNVREALALLKDAVAAAELGGGVSETVRTNIASETEGDDEGSNETTTN